MLRRHTRALAVALAPLGLLLAACGGGTDTAGNGGNGGSDGGGDGEGLTGTLTVWDWQYGSPTFGPTLQKLDEQFQAEHPGVTVEHVSQPITNYNQLLQTAFSSRTGPDAVLLLTAGSGTLNFKDALTPLDDYVDEAGLRDQLIGWAEVSDGYDPANGVYGIPYTTQGSVFYYNKALFEQAGLDPEAPPTTWAELEDMAATLKAAGIVPFGGGEKEGLESTAWFSAYWSAAQSPDDSVALGAGDLPFTDPRVAEAFAPFFDFAEKGYFEDDLRSTSLFPDAVDRFAAGNEAIMLGLASDAASYAQFNEALGVENVGVFQVPGTDAGPPKALPYGAGTAWSIPAYSEQKDLAMAYIEFLTSQESQELALAEAAALPTNVDAEPPADAVPQLVAILEAQRSSEVATTPHSFWPAGVVQVAMAEMPLVLDGDTTLDAVLANMQSGRG